MISRLYGVWHYLDNRDNKEAHAIHVSILAFVLRCLLVAKLLEGRILQKRVFSIYSKEVINVYLFIGKNILNVLLLQI